MGFDIKSIGEREITEYKIEILKNRNKILHFFNVKYSNRYLLYFFKHTFFSISYTQIKKR